MARNRLLCADVPLRNYSLTLFQYLIHLVLIYSFSVLCMMLQVFCFTSTLCLLLTVSALSKKMQTTVIEMLKELEQDKSAGQYVVWLRFIPLVCWRDCRKESITEFLQGELFSSNVLSCP